MSLAITRGSAEGDEHPLDSELVIGRDPGADLTVEDAGISRRHARLRPTDDGAAVIEDLGSSNGTFVNGERISGERRLADGDELRIGGTAIAIRGAGAATQILGPEDDATEIVEPPPAAAEPGERERPFIPAPSTPPAAPRQPAPAPAPERAPIRERPPTPPPAGGEDTFNWIAVLAFLLGPMSILLILLGRGSAFYAALPVAVAAIVSGSIGKRAVDRGEKAGLRGLAQAGRIFGIVGLIVAAAAIIALIVLNAVLDAAADNLDGLIDEIRSELDSGFSLPEELRNTPD